MTTEVLQGRTRESVLELTRGEIESALGGLPEDKHHCARYAAEAAHAAAVTASTR